MKTSVLSAKWPIRARCDHLPWRETFHGESVKAIRQAFKEAIDFDLHTCAERGERPNKPHSGKLMLRVTPEIHSAVSTAAETSGKSINQWVTEVLSAAARL